MAKYRVKGKVGSRVAFCASKGYEATGEARFLVDKNNKIKKYRANYLKWIDMFTTNDIYILFY